MSDKNCNFCSSQNLTKILNFGSVALAGGFLSREGVGKENKYPMTFSICSDCGGVQIAENINEDEMFSNYFYFSSQIKTLENHFKNHAKNISTTFLKSPSNSSVLEFGSNDGILLRPLVEEGIGQVIGVDPAENVVLANQVKGANQIVGYFNSEMADDLLEQFGKQDLILANNCYAHINNINSTTNAVKKMLKKDGVFIFEVHHLLKLIEELQFDMIYHEHIYYYSVIFLNDYFKKFAMQIIKVDEISIHAGSIRVYATHDSSKYSANIHSSVQKVLKKELDAGLNQTDAYIEFADNVINFKKEMNSLISDIKSSGKSIIGYGASGRANTILQFCGIDSSHLEYIIDDSPPKQGFFTPGSHIEIVDKTVLEDKNYDYILLFAWAFLDEIAKKNIEFLKKGGKFIVPFPELKIVGIEDLVL
tara:strand:+ start:113 stop:1372 length:1260 start_codon:yes stop_codon:yes gene_type:complete